jgi:hypothetical protein
MSLRSKKTAFSGPSGIGSFVFALMVFAGPVFAQQQGTSILQVPVPADQTNKIQFYGQLRFEDMQYMTTLPEAPNLSQSQFLSAQISLVQESSWIENAVDFGAGTFFSRNQSHIAVHELYTSPRTDNFRVYVGRKLNAWSEMDREWNLGIWQPYFEIDALRPEAQGLTGVFFDVNRSDFQVLGFVTPMFIPSMGPDIREENGALVSDSRWYRSPSNQLDFTNKPIPVSYSLSVPETSELVGHGGYGAMGRVGNKDRGPWLVSSFGYAPVNSLLLKRNIRLPIADPNVGVIVSPEVTYHKVFSSDLGYTMGNVRATVSYLQDDPETRLPDMDWAIQKLDGIRAYSASLDWNVPQFLTRSVLLQVSYLKVDGGGIQDITADGTSDSLNLFDQRLKFTNAVKVKVQGELARIFHRPLVTKFSWLYDRDQKGSMINSEFLFYPSQVWALVVGTDILGVDDENYKPSNFLNEYRANDRVYGGMTYVF